MNKYDSPLVLDNENSVSLIINQIKPNSVVLEFGPATGRLTKYLKNELKCSVYIVEIDKDAFKKSIEFAEDGINGDIENYEWLEYYKDIKFNYIIYADVLEHLVNPQDVLMKSKSLLAEDGIIITSIPNIAHNAVIIDLINNKFNYNKTGIMDNTHLRFFTYYSLQQLFENCNLTIIDENVVKLNYDQIEIENNNLYLPTDQAEMLKDREFAFVYQFVFTSVNKDYYIKNIDKIKINKYKTGDGHGTLSLQSVFIDTGNGFNEDNKLTQAITLYDSYFSINLDLSGVNNIQGLRFDPCEYACKVKIDKITSNIDDIKIYPQNASLIQKEYEVFTHNDPIYILQSNNIDKIKYLHISGEILSISKYEIYSYFDQWTKKIKDEESIIREKIQTECNMSITVLKNDVDKLKKEVSEKNDQILLKNLETEKWIDKYNKDFEKVETQLDTKNKKIEELENKLDEKNILVKKILEETENVNKQLQHIYKSSSWKITKPLRLFKRILNKVQNRTYNFTIDSKKLILIDKDTKNRFYDIHVSVVIPTYNGENYIEKLISSLTDQEGIKKIEIIIIDSQSSDDTVKICEENGIVPIKIMQKDFSHSYARNLGASKATGDYILFMTQDALPSNKYWIYNMVTPIIKHNVVAVSCMELPREDCELAYRVECNNFAKYIGIIKTDKIGKLPKRPNYETIRKNAQLNDVSCVISKAIFEEFKYFGDYAEDLEMGVRLIKSGYKIALLSSERVIHSHNRSCGYYLRRSIVDSKNLKKILPDFPVSEKEIHSIIDATLFAYYKIICMLDYLQYTNEFIESPQKLFVLINNYWNSIGTITSVSIDKLQFDKNYSDTTVDKFLHNLIKLNNNNIVQETYLIGHIFHYINNTLAPFVVNDYFVTFDIDLRKQVIDAIFKRFVSVCGNELSLYVISHPQNQEINNLIYELQKGV